MNLVRKEDRLVDNLLELCVLQVGAHHHLQHLEQLAVADVPVVVHVVNSEKKLRMKV
jgi:PII-like signaling protein